MTVAELIAALQQQPPDLPVVTEFEGTWYIVDMVKTDTYYVYDPQGPLSCSDIAAVEIS